MTQANNSLNSKSGPSPLARAKFGPGRLLQHEDLEQLNNYTRELSRLLFRSFFGCGVVCGLKVEMTEVCRKPGILVHSGLALDCKGDPIHLPKDESLSLDSDCEGTVPSPLWVLLCRTSKCCSPRPSTCASDDDESSSSCTRERDYWEIRIVETRPDCVCGCANFQDTFESDCWCVNPEHPCYAKHYQGECGCDLGENCDCCCDCVVLARLTQVTVEGRASTWEVDHSVRRFIRPVLMRDPLVPRANAAQPQSSQQQQQQQQQQQRQPGVAKKILRPDKSRSTREPKL